jgi:hypothetical protein
MRTYGVNVKVCLLFESESDKKRTAPVVMFGRPNSAARSLAAAIF